MTICYENLPTLEALESILLAAEKPREIAISPLAAETVVKVSINADSAERPFRSAIVFKGRQISYYSQHRCVEDIERWIRSKLPAIRRMQATSLRDSLPQFSFQLSLPERADLEEAVILASEALATGTVVAMITRPYNATLIAS